MKIIDNKTGRVFFEEEKYTCRGIVTNFLDEIGFPCETWDSLSDIVKTTTGDSSTPFNTIGEMIDAIPDIINYGEETEILCVYSKGRGVEYFILGWDNDENEELWNCILQTYRSNLILSE